MTQELWNSVDRYIADALIPADPALNAALEATERAGMPAISVSPNHGKLLYLLARLVDARRILEIGTLGGYSTIWLARALREGGRVISLEIDPRHAEVARANLERAGVSAVVDVRVGRALDLLADFADDDRGTFDLVFIDADKRSNPEYFIRALELTRVGGLIVIDNVVRDGRVIDDATDDPDIRGVRRLYELLADEPRVSATAIQTVGVKGYDGLAIALVRSAAGT